MRSIAETLAQLAITTAERLTTEEKLSIEDVLDAAADVMSLGLPLEVFARIGICPSPRTGAPSPEKTRNLAVIITAPSDPRRAHLLKVIDKLLLFQGWTFTNQGLFSPYDLGSGGITLHSAPQPAPAPQQMRSQL